MAINLASKYASKVDERFKLKELTANGLNTDYNWEGVNTITVYGVNVPTLNNYSKTGANRYGTPAELEDTIKSYTVSTDKAFTYTIDEFHKKSQMGVKEAGRSLARTIDEVIVPFKDMQRLAVWSTTATATTQVDNTAPTKSNAYSLFLGLQAMLDDKLVPQANRILYATPAYCNLIKQDSSFIKAGDLSQNMLIKNQVGEIDGVKIVKVPTSYFSAATISAILVYTPCTISPAKLTEYKTHTNPPGINGDLVEGRIMMDTFVLEQKKNGVAMLDTAYSA